MIGGDRQLPPRADAGSLEIEPQPPASPTESWWVPLAVVAAPLLIREVDKRFIRKEIKRG